MLDLRIDVLMVTGQKGHLAKPAVERSHSHIGLDGLSLAMNACLRVLNWSLGCCGHIERVACLRIV